MEEQSSHILSFTCEWPEDANGKFGGSFIAERKFNLTPLTDKQAQAWLGSVILTQHYNRDGEETRQELGDEVAEVSAEIFDQICPDNKDVPIEVKTKVLDTTVFKVDAERVFFKRGDPNAPGPGETVINITYWHPDGEVQEDGSLPKKSARIFFRIPTAADTKAYRETAKKRPPERDTKGRVLSESAGISIQKLAELIYGSDLKSMQPLYLRAEGYGDSPPPFFHLNQAVACLFTEAKHMGEVSRRLNGKSSTA